MSKRKPYPFSLPQPAEDEVIIYVHKGRDSKGRQPFTAFWYDAYPERRGATEHVQAQGFMSDLEAHKQGWIANGKRITEQNHD